MSIRVFREFLTTRPDGSVDASRIISRECYEAFLQAKKSQHDDNEAKKFRRTLTTHLTGVDGRRPFDKAEEEAILQLLRQNKPWPCFPPELQVGSMFRGKGFHEKQIILNQVSGGENTTSATAAAGGKSTAASASSSSSNKRAKTDAATTASEAPNTMTTTATTSAALATSGGLPFFSDATTASVSPALPLLPPPPPPPPLLHKLLAASSAAAAAAAATTSSPVLPPALDVNNMQQLAGADQVARTILNQSDNGFVFSLASEVVKFSSSFASFGIDVWRSIFGIFRFVILARTAVVYHESSDEYAQDLCDRVSAEDDHRVSVTIMDVLCKDFDKRIRCQNDVSRELFGVIAKSNNSEVRMQSKDLFDITMAIGSSYAQLGYTFYILDQSFIVAGQTRRMKIAYRVDPSSLLLCCKAIPVVDLPLQVPACVVEPGARGLL